MNDFRKNVVSIILAAVSGTKQPVSPEFNLIDGYKLAKKHGILVMFYHGLEICGVHIDPSLTRELLNEFYKYYLISEQQVHEYKTLTERFDVEKIEYLPLKGAVLKEIYPKAEMRTMGDVDILINLEQYSKVTNILHELGYQFKYESGHELVWKKSALLLELHKSVMTKENKDFYRYFGNGWGIAKKCPGEGSRYELSVEDFFIYMFVHFTKHYRISGIGIRHMVDLWVYIKAFPQMDQDYVSVELKKMKLNSFYQNVLSTLDVWFADTPENEITELITDVIFSSGEYGTAEMTVVNRVIRDRKKSESVSSSKRRKVFKVMFLPYGKMCEKYAYLKKLPFLLPVAWMVRWVDILLFKRENLTTYQNDLKKINESSLNEHQKALSFVGLEFDFGE